ncbi:MAG: hypothetical protein ACREMY_06475 [bacterium]
MSDRQRGASKKHRPFFTGYGGAAPSIQISRAPAPEAMRSYRSRIGRLLLLAMLAEAIMPWVFALLPGVEAPYASRWSEACAWSPIRRVLLLSHGFGAFCFSLLACLAIWTFPYATLPALARRIISARAHLSSLAGCLVLTPFVLFPMVVPTQFCSFRTFGIGHGADLMHLMTSSLSGASLLEPLFWATSFLSVSVTLLIATTGAYRAFTPNVQRQGD